MDYQYYNKQNIFFGKKQNDLLIKSKKKKKKQRAITPNQPKPAKPSPKKIF